MGKTTAKVVICGAGIAGISAAYHLAVKRAITDVVLVDERSPLSLTSDKSTECYRNWWPGPGDAMVRLMNRSIDILENLARESDNMFRLNRRGYLFVTANPARVVEFQHAAEEAESLGSGTARIHPGDSEYVPAPSEGFEDQPTGSDLILSPVLIRKHFPYLSERAVAVLHARRCGWLSAQQLGMYLLERGREQGVRFLQARVEGVEVNGGRVRSVRLSDGTTLATDAVVNAAGPFVKPVGKMMGIDLPVFSELHAKVAFRDDVGVFPRDAPLLIWTDPQVLSWSEEERTLFAEAEETRSLLGEFPAGVHARPEGGPTSSVFLGLWTYHTEPVEPILPLQFDASLPEIVVRGLATMLPGLHPYVRKLLRPVIDGGYYTKTQENRPLIGRLPVQGAYVIGALSGFGIMAACAAGELLAAHVIGDALPPYAAAFALERYQDPEYQRLLEHWEDSGQL